jgi:hypothetical protein
MVDMLHKAGRTCKTTYNIVIMLYGASQVDQGAPEARLGPERSKSCPADGLDCSAAPPDRLSPDDTFCTITQLNGCLECDVRALILCCCILLQCPSSCIADANKQQRHYNDIASCACHRFEIRAKLL